MKKVLITGGSGGIAQAIKALLEREGYEVFAPGRSQLDVTDWHSVDRVMQEFVPDILELNDLTEKTGKFLFLKLFQKPRLPERITLLLKRRIFRRL